MDFMAWTKLLGRTQEDPDLKAALAAAGVKKIPKLDEGDTFVQVELKGHGLELILTDEASLKELDDQDLGEGPLIVTGVLAKLAKSHGRDLYSGALPSGITMKVRPPSVEFSSPSPSPSIHRSPATPGTAVSLPVGRPVKVAPPSVLV